MLYTLENEWLCVTVADHGAELKSMKEKADGTEYLWNGDPSWWKYSSPVLFPIVGKLADGKYRIGEHQYELPLGPLLVDKHDRLRSFQPVRERGREREWW